MRAISKLLLLIVAIIPATIFAQKTITAASIIASVNSHTPVSLSDMQITGDLDFTKLDNMKLESKNSDDKVYVSTVTSPVSFTNCTFTGKVLGYVNPDETKPLVKHSTCTMPILLLR